MMTIHALHGGDGYEYLTRQVATADRELARGQGLTDYYNEHGTPPGVWAGRGAEIMGVSGEVSEAQMRALYGEGMNPNADKIIAEQIAQGEDPEAAIKAAKLGTGLYRFKGGTTAIQTIYERRKAEFIAAEDRSPTRDEWLELRTEAAREHLTSELGRKPSRDEITKALGDEKRKAREAVVGWDCTFTPQKSVSILWGLGDDDLRRAIWKCHEEAVHEVLTRMEDTYALARRGRGGQQIVDTAGLTFAKFQHYDNRTGDMNPHTHVVVSAMVKGIKDNKWTCLDARHLTKAAVSLSCEYNAALTGKLKRELGLRFEERSRGRGKEPVLEVVGVSDDMINHFSRRANIMARTEELVRQYRQTHGHDPSKAVQIKLAQQATLDTREDKPLPKTLREMIIEWDQRAAQVLGDGRTGRQYAADIVHLSHNPDASRPYEATRVAIEVGADLGGKSAVLATDEMVLLDTIERALDRCILGDQITRADAAHEIRQLLAPSYENHLLDDLDAAIVARERAEYNPEKIAADVVEKVSRRRATWAETHIRAAAEDRLAVCDFATDNDHRAAVEHVVSRVRELSIQLTVDPDAAAPKAMARTTGENIFNGPASTSILYTNEDVLAAEKRLQQAAQEPTAELLTRADVTRAITQVENETRGRTLGVRTGKARRLLPGQRHIVEHFCTSGARLAVAVGPAGTGKTTAMQAVVRAWHNNGRTVIALSPQMSAARVLSEDIGVPARTIDSFIARARIGADIGLQRGTMILVDEAGMASTHNLDALQRIADEHGAVVRWIGDPSQLSAVESGGALRLIATDTNAPELTEVVRFNDPDEAAATLDVRSGDAERAWEFYARHDRITSGMADELREKILTAHLDDVAAGKTSLMMAGSVADVYALNGAAQAAHALRGTIDTSSARATLADGHNAHIGDIVVTRKNNHRLRITGGSRARTPVDNGDLWRVHAVHSDGALTVVGTRHRGRVTLPGRYVRDYTELGYASTVHRAQGMTVDRAHLLMNAVLGRSLAYVGLSRGRERNAIYVATDALPDPSLDRIPEEPDNEHDVFMRVLAREDDNLTATEVMRAEQARISDPARTRAMYEHATELLSRARAEYLLDRALPVMLFSEARRSENFHQLLDTIGIAESLGMDSAALVTDIATRDGEDLGESLISARDVAAVLRTRADIRIGAYIQNSTVPATVVAGIETLAYSPTLDTAVVTAAVAATNTEDTTATTQRGGRFIALRDAQLPAVRPMPTRYPGVDVELAEFAESLYMRLTGTETTRLADNRPTVPATAADKLAVLDAYADAASPIDRRAKIQRDYDYYIRELSHERGRWLLDRAFPVALVHQIERSRSYASLLDTLALADAHGLDTGALMAALVDRTDGGSALITTRDAAAALRAGADEWIGDHAVTTIDTTTTAELDTLTGKLDTHAAELTQLAIDRSISADVLAVTARPSRWRALDNVAPPRGLAPIPPQHPGMDLAMADYADELRRLLLDLPADAPDWRARAAQITHLTDVTDLDEDLPADVAETATDQIGGERVAELTDAAEQLAPGVTEAPAWPALRERLAEIDLDGRDPVDDLAAAIAMRDLEGVDDTAAVLVWRLDHLDLSTATEHETDATTSEAGPDTHIDAATSIDDATEEPDPGEEWAEEFTPKQGRPVELPYPDLSPTDRVLRLHAELTETRARVAELFEQVITQTHPHQLAIEPRIAQMRLRMDALRPLVLAVREAQQQWEEAEFDAIAAEDTYQSALQAHPESADEELIASVQQHIDALGDDQAALRARLTEQLETYRSAATENAADAVTVNIARTKADAEAARAHADELREQLRNAHHELDTAAGGEPVPTEDEVHTWRDMAETLATDELNAARAEMRRLDTLLFHATRQAANEQHATTGIPFNQAVRELEDRYLHADTAQQASTEQHTSSEISDSQAAWELDNRRRESGYISEADTGIGGDDEPHIAPTTPTEPITHDIDTENTMDSEAAVDIDQDTAPDVEHEPADPSAAREQQILEQMQAEPLRMRSDTALDNLIRNLRRAATRRDDPAAWQGFANAQTRTEQVRAAHARLLEQADAIRAAQAAQAAAEDAGRELGTATAETHAARQNLAAISALRPGARREAQARVERCAATEERAKEQAAAAKAAARAAVEAARDAGAPQAQWAALLARADDRTALAAELAEAERGDARDEEIRERTAQRAAQAARDLEAALAERQRRTDLSPVDAAAEHRIRAAHSPTETTRSELTQEQRAAAQAELNRQHHRDHGHEL
ncbi:MobF family relaxase [Nocardia veterana]|uniref:Relaxase domain-containing protein n=4 Tax=Nocardia veterana TaxID=132249 RepID=A0A7X6M2A3_9NOCA|nr:MobF family relaxase [Nocardia veterana]NKY88907.1 relaxase domain-containing protein [Nocardia veterana]